MYIYNLGQRFQKIVKQHPNKCAIKINGDFVITFNMLEEYSNRVANFLIQKQIEKNDVVAIQNSKSLIGFSVMLACLKTGAVYTNFDYENPDERIGKIFDTACPRIVIADCYRENISELCDSTGIEYCIFEPDNTPYLLNNYSPLFDDNIIDNITGDSPAYIMFTSGSTGVPKGVLISQRSIINLIDWGQRVYSLSDSDIMTNVNPIYFDNSVFDFYCSVFNGITMIAFQKQLVSNPKQLIDITNREKCTFWFSVPSMLIYLTNMKLLSNEVLRSIRIFAFGGEGYPKELLRKLYSVYKDSADFYNVYGPTEGTCICSAYRITEADMNEEGLCTLGNIANNFDYMILDASGQRSHIGELCLMGDQLALGYYNDAERTAKAFVSAPGYKFYRKMYKTGDLIEEKNGKLYFLGRIDNQIKHMGYRIELEEIENALIKLPGVKQCAAIHTLSKNNLSKITAYLAIDKTVTSDIPPQQALRKLLSEYIPQYMIPNDFIIMDELPKNANGKVDRVMLREELSNLL